MNKSGFEPLGALRALTEGGVVFVVIGGIGGRIHGSTTVTNDLDICYERSPANLDRLAAVLRAAGATLRGVDDDVPFVLDGETLAAGDAFTFNTSFGALDILGTPTGTGGFAGLADGAVRYDLGDIEVLVASLDDIIAMKQAAGRPKDLIEVEVLGALREEIDRASRE
jgi:hypothetical protein